MTSETFECRAFLVAWIALAEAGKKKAGRDGPRSGAAYTEGGQKRQGDGFRGSKNRYSKINGLSMWFHDTTIFWAKYEAVNAQSLSRTRRGRQTGRSATIRLSFMMGKKTHLICVSRDSAARQLGLGNGCGKRKNLLGWQGELRHPSCLSLVRAKSRVVHTEGRRTGVRIGEIRLFEAFRWILPRR
ncbi:Hypothetical protein NGAL_HAMBI1145_37630 [Neorhizobium galegae bv. officinalis]|uniref:Uncharacterized protein n=1 Tax=Neorhizobium galegae bv. officinalis TaxID=323656 RepID=A0A0T7FQH8_NEOGA|nr:hypothetical protein [Neorhizobium galegae]CDZ37248.1 Hypothetical protein NGAL_HAMBI1145_37630 [Neorhizobium galegae bv. officinalis]